MKSIRTTLMATVLLAAPFAAQAAGAAQPAEGLTFSGKMYASFLSVDNKGASSMGTAVDRFYLSAKAPVNADWSAQLTTDVSNESAVAGLSKKANVFVKYVYLENTSLVSDAKIRLGAAPMPWVGYVENIWGYRYVEKVLIDQAGFGTSSDYGIHLVRSSKELGLDYAVSAVNGGGYGTPATTKALDFVGRVSYKVPQYEGLEVSVGARTGYVGNNTAANAAVPGQTFKRANRFDLLASYKSDLYSVAVEYLYATNYKNVLGTVIDPTTLKTYDVKTNGFSLFGQAGLAGTEAHVFGRYDSVKPNTKIAQTDSLLVIGAAMEPAKNLSLALVYKQSDSTGAAVVGNQKVTSIGLMGQVKF